MLCVLLATAVAGTWKNPAALRDDALVTGTVGSSVSSRTLTAQGCEGDRCESTETRTVQTGRLELRPHDLVSVWAEGGRAHHVLGGSGHDATGLVLSAGVHLALPKRGWRPAVSARGTRMTTELLSQADEVTSSTGFDQVDLAAFAVWGDHDEQVMVWFGAEAALQHTLGMDNLSTDVALWLDPKWPAAAVVGAEVWSTPLGPPWGRGARLRAGVEARAGSSMSLGVWLSVSG
jgi:hypothetical protein